VAIFEDRALRLPADTFLQINDQINTVMTRYEAFKKGDYSITANPVPAETSGPLSLIDLDEEQAQPQAASSTPANDLSGLFSTPSPPQVTTTSSNIPPNLFSLLNNPSNFASPQPMQHGSNGQQMAGFGGFNHSGSPLGQTNTPPAAIRLGSTNSSPAPNYFGNNAGPKGPVPAFGGMGSLQQSPPQQSQSPFQSMQPQMVGGSQMQPSPAASSTPAPQQQQQQKKDPFADLAGLF
jgi:ADP-ribosylation factor-binding protein GGA